MLTQHTIEETDEERMSTEENPNEEDVKPVKRSVLKTARSLLDYWQVGLKLLELTICILCTALVVDPLKSANVGSRYLHHLSLIFATYIGYMLIITLFLLGRIFQDRLPYKTSAIFSLVGAGLFLSTGCVIFSEKDYLSRNNFFHPNMYMFNMLITSGVFAIVNFVVFVIDGILTIRFQNDL